MNRDHGMNIAAKLFNMIYIHATEMRPRLTVRHLRDFDALICDTAYHSNKERSFLLEQLILVLLQCCYSVLFGVLFSWLSQWLVHKQVRILILPFK